MSLFSELENLNISREEILNLDERSLIRIEKLLKVAIREQADLDINQVEKIITVLRENKQALTLMYTDNFEGFRKAIISGEVKAFQTYSGHQGVYSDELKAFVDAYLSTDILAYFDKCFKANKFDAALSMLQYQSIYSYTLLDQLAEKFRTRLNYGTECISIMAERLMQKIESHTNLHFYQCLNAFEGISFDSEISDLLNVVVDRLPQKKALLSILYAMSEYMSTGEELRATIYKNRTIAVREGVRERQERNGNRVAYFRGVELKHSPRNQTRSSGRSGGYGWAGVIVFIIIAIIRIGIRSNSVFRDDDTDQWQNEYFEGFKQSQEDLYSGEKRLAGIKTKILNCQDLFEGEIISETAADFIKDTSVFSVSNIKDRIEVELKNSTNQDIIVLYHNIFSVGTLFIPSGKTVVTKELIIDFSMYTGRDFQKVEYFGEYGDTTLFYRFKTFTERDKANLNTVIDMMNAPRNNRMKIGDIVNKNGQLTVNWYDR